MNQLEQVLGRGVRQLAHAEVVDDEQVRAGQLGEVVLVVQLRAELEAVVRERNDLNIEAADWEQAAMNWKGQYERERFGRRRLIHRRRPRPSSLLGGAIRRCVGRGRNRNRNPFERDLRGRRT